MIDELSEKLITEVVIQNLEESFTLLSDLRIRVPERVIDAFHILVVEVAILCVDKLCLLLELIHQLQARCNQMTAAKGGGT